MNQHTKEKKTHHKKDISHEQGNAGLIFHGAGCEVGRSCIEVLSGNRRFLLDAGLKIIEERTEPPVYPTEISDINGIESVFITHAHLDHCGALPLLNFHGLDCPIYCTSLTKALAKVMLEDSLKVEMIEENEPEYTRKNIRNALRLMVPVEYDKVYSYSDLRFTAIDAGHIPGSASFLIDADGKKILYTGDINTEDSQLLSGAGDYAKSARAAGGVDVAIIESTYGDQDHMPRQKVEKEFLERSYMTYATGGSAIIPVFALGRSQEILMLLSESKNPLPIYFDGMGQKLTRIMLEFPHFLRDERALRKAFNAARLVKGWKDRAEIIKERGIFLTTSGMLEGGPVLDYLDHLWFDTKNSILLTGYQAEGTNGRALMSERKVKIKTHEGDEVVRNVKCYVESFDFSSHSGATNLVNVIESISPGKVVLQHGDPPALEAMKASLSKYKPIVPENDWPFEA